MFDRSLLFILIRDFHNLVSDSEFHYKSSVLLNGLTVLNFVTICGINSSN